MLPSMAGTVRNTREERREQALAAAREEFARAGMQGSVDLVAERAGVTASYLLRLFGTKKYTPAVQFKAGS
jgi:AcrR family transcriptional regulator